MKPGTELPWSAEKAHDKRYVIASEMRTVCYDVSRGEDAAYIAHACNLYPELVDALNAALHQLETPGDFLPSDTSDLIDDLTALLTRAEPEAEPA